MVHGLSNLLRYYQKIRAVGIARAVRAVRFRIQRQFFINRVRHTTFNQEGTNVIQLPTVPLHYLDVCAHTVHYNQVRMHADRAVAGQFDLLGSGQQTFKDIPWHCDIRLAIQKHDADYTFDARQFYADIPIQSGAHELVKDVKVPWEISRFQHLPVLGLACLHTADVNYATTAKEQVIDWLNNNTYLLGVNWMSSMEVAIRATNWIVAWYWLRTIWSEDQSFMRRFTVSLQEHMRYIEGNWEFYDGRTSNHYLANLIGYFYLCWFFQNEPGMKAKRDWCYREILREFDWQIFEEGTSYEGSTRYHQLVTECMLHATLLAREMGIEVHDSIMDKLDRMLAFIDWCTPTAAGQTVTIGDDDSGSLLKKEVLGFTLFAQLIVTSKRTLFGVKHYTQFGISISKASDWHVTLRHHAYSKRQPSGHFHEDAGSVTIAYNGIPIVIDPGSYLYTASRDWRNMFRSAAMHNVCYTTGHHCTEKDLFTLDLQEAMCDTRSQHGGQLCTQYRLADNRCVDRSITIDDRVCVISDWVIGEGDELTTQFILDPAITVEQRAGSWFLLYQHTMLLQLSIPAHAQLSVEDTWMAPRYGRKVRTSSLHITHLTGASVILLAFHPQDERRVEPFVALAK